MASIKQDDLANPAFFSSQSQKLHALLSTVVHESTTATNPDAAIDFLQLTEILSSLLEESQMYSVLNENDLMQRSSGVKSFMGKIETVQSVIQDWDVRTAPPATATRKRARTETQSDYDTRANRRRLEGEAEHALSMAPTFEGPYSEMIPLGEYVEREKERVAWWTEPYYD